MDDESKDQTASTLEKQDTQTRVTSKREPRSDREGIKTVSRKKTDKCQPHRHGKKGKSIKKYRKKRVVSDDSDSDSSTDEESDSSDSSSRSSSLERERKKLKKRKQANISSKIKKEKSKKTKKQAEESSKEDADSESGDEAAHEGDSPNKKTPKKSDKPESEAEKDASNPENDLNTIDNIEAGMKKLWTQISELKAEKDEVKSKKSKAKSKSKSKSQSTKSRSKSSEKPDSLDYKRVDQLWDSNIHNYKLKETTEEDETEFAEFAFLVRRRFDWENKYESAVIDIKSKQLRDVLSEVMKDCKSVSLEVEEPAIDPNTLFLYLEDFRKYYKKTLKAKIKTERKKKNIKKLEQQRALCKILVRYIDEDYADVKKTLYPLLEAGNITFDLLWALFTPNDIAVTSCYGSWDDPRCFKVDYAMKYKTMTRGEWYCIEGKYLEYDGKGFGYGDFEVDIESFKGPRKITSLTTYPLKYHKNPDAVKKQIIDRGEKFVAMEGMQYKFMKGMAYMKKKKQILKININGRAMIDPATFRRVNPNYQISSVKAKDDDELFSDSDNDGSVCSCSCCADDSDNDGIDHDDQEQLSDDDMAAESNHRYKYKWVEDEDGDTHYTAVEVDEEGEPIRHERLDMVADSTEVKNRTFTEEQLLLTSPVVLGFAFSEKLWLEFSLSGVQDITYNEEAFSSLVLPHNQKSIVRALVESHKFHAAKTIDDVVQGKGKGLVFVLHGPPGTGKTLTAEGISEMLKCPLYMVSAGELGTDPARLEQELQKILDIAHSWGAVLLLDEADVFLEKRQSHDIHRNALVSIFLRLLEYYQGILFLTTNRVETFDDAFQSRIHAPLRYADLTVKAKKTVWKTFLDKVRQIDGTEVADFSEDDLDSLARHSLNGRQIKNTVRTAQALALNERKKLTMEHIKRVLDVAETFDRDLKGGTGYIDAMRSYT